MTGASQLGTEQVPARDQASRAYPAAWGPSKKEAEQKAAQNALVELGLLASPEAILADAVLGDPAAA